VVDPKLGLFFVLSIELYEEEEDRDGVEERGSQIGRE